MKTICLMPICLCVVAALLASEPSNAQQVGRVGLNQEVSWEQGPDAPPSSDKRPPNIVLIVADDLGAGNDVETNGYRLAGPARIAYPDRQDGERRAKRNG